MPIRPFLAPVTIGHDPVSGAENGVKVQLLPWGVPPNGLGRLPTLHVLLRPDGTWSATFGSPALLAWFRALPCGYEELRDMALAGGGESA